LARAAAAVPGGFLVAGTNGVIKLDSGGNVMWTKTYEGEELLELSALAANRDGSFYLAGYYSPQASAFAMSLSPRGDVNWARRYTAASFTRARATRDGGVALVGNTRPATATFWPSSWARRAKSNGRPPSTTASTAPTARRAHARVPRRSRLRHRRKARRRLLPRRESYSNFPIPERTPVGYYATAVTELSASGELVSSTIYRAPDDSLYGGAYAVAVRENGSPLLLGRRADEATDLLNNEDILLVQEGTFLSSAAPATTPWTVARSPAPAAACPFKSPPTAAIFARHLRFVRRNPALLVVKLNRNASIQLPTRDTIGARRSRWMTQQPPH
jgi:hypothetical protein